MDSIIRFSFNWNNKLANQAFTTLRLHNPNKYRVGQLYEIFIKSGNGDKFITYAEIYSIKTITIDKINNFISYLDTGYSVDECKRMLKKMYPDANWDKQLLDFILLVKIKQDKSVQRGYDRRASS